MILVMRGPLFNTQGILVQVCIAHDNPVSLREERAGYFYIKRAEGKGIWNAENNPPKPNPL